MISDHHAMNNFLRLDYVSCVVCGKSVKYRIYNKHWAQFRGHRTDENPYSSRIHRSSSSEDAADSIQFDDGSAFVDHIDSSVLDNAERSLGEMVETSQDRETQNEQIAEAGTDRLRIIFDDRKAHHL